jgi:hypothetical protein
MLAMAKAADRGQLRNFGLIVGGIFGAIGLWPALIRGGDARTWCLVLAVLLIVPAVTAPTLLWPAHRAWMTLGSVLGWVNTRIILGIVFFVVITPMGLVIRLFGRDPMQRAFEPDATTYRVRRTSRPGTHLLRQF